MFFSKRSIFSSLGLAVLVGFTSWLAIESSDNYHGKTKLPPSFIVNQASDATLYQMNEQGKLKYKAIAKTVDNLANNDANMTKVDMTLLPQKPGELPWHITANYGFLSDNNSKLKLWGHVIISRPGDGEKKLPLKITTSLLYIYPNKDFAQTDKFVKMQQIGSKNVVTGTGMNAYLHPENIQLLSNVRSYYENTNNNEQGDKKASPIKKQKEQSELKDDQTMPQNQVQQTP